MWTGLHETPIALWWTKKGRIPPCVSVVSDFPRFAADIGRVVEVEMSDRVRKAINICEAFHSLCQGVAICPLARRVCTSISSLGIPAPFDRPPTNVNDSPDSLDGSLPGGGTEHGLSTQYQSA